MSQTDRPAKGKAGLPKAAPVMFPDVGRADVDASRRPTPPRHVVIATWLMWANAAFALVSLIVAVATPAADYIAAARAVYPDLPADQIGRLADSARVYTAVIPSIFLAAYLALTVPIRRGRRWARLLTWFLAGIGLVALAAQVDSVVAQVLTVVGAGIDVGIIWLLATKQSRAFFPKPQRVGISELRKTK